MLMGGPWIHSDFFTSLSLSVSFFPPFFLFLPFFLLLSLSSPPSPFSLSPSSPSFFFGWWWWGGAQFSWKQSFLCAKENREREAGAYAGI